MSALLSVLYAMAVVVAGWFVGGFLAGGVAAVLGRTPLEPTIRVLLVRSTRPLTLLISVIAALSLLAFDTSGLIALMGTAGLAIGLGLKESLSNVASGALILTVRPYELGDEVEFAGVQGRVRAVGLFTTSLNTSEGTMVTLLNDLALKGPVHNLSRRGRRQVEARVEVSTQEFAAVKAAILDAIAAAEGLNADPPPLVLLDGISARGLTLSVRAWVDVLSPNPQATLYAAVLEGLRAVQAENTQGPA